MKRIIYALIVVLSPLCIQAQAPGTNGRAEGVRPKPVTESSKTPVEKAPELTEFYKDMGVPVDIDDPASWLARQADLRSNGVTEADVLPAAVAEKLREMEARLLQLQLLNEQLRADNESIRRSMYACCGSSEDASGIEPSLYQNVPNPATDETAIGFFLPEAAKEARLDIRDTAGKLIKRIPLNERGNSKVNIDRTLLHTGTFIYTLYVDEKLIDSKILLIQQ
jgi:hypothetical protein